MSGFARPVLLSSSEWLADELGRGDVRIVDVRWRPDGTIDFAASFDLADDGRVAAIWMVRNPEKLSHLGRAVGLR